MSTTQPKKIGGAALAVALVVAALVAATAPRGPAPTADAASASLASSNDCSAPNTLTFDQQESDSLLRPTDVEDKWVVDVPNRPSTVQLDVDKTGDEVEVELYEEDNGTCSLIGTQSVGPTPEFDGLSDNQKYWPHVRLASSDDDQADYTIIMEDD